MWNRRLEKRKKIKTSWEDGKGKDGKERQRRDR
jgi:hypothetical protein